MMVIARSPLTPAGRAVAVFLGVVCVAAGGFGLGLGVARHSLLLAVPGVGVLAIGVLYAGAAWRGRPWR